MKLLIVDDQALNLKLARAVFALEGYEVSTAPTAEAALALIAEDVPDALLTDIQLPGIDGLELVRRLRSDPRTARMPMVAITAYAMKGDRETALDAGCDDYVAKPIDTRTLPGRIAALLGVEARA